METGTWKVKKGLAQMLKGGVIMDVTNPEQAKIAEAAGGLKNVRLPGIWLPNENVYSFAV
jgi:pyridoxal biosynthesis lyase PdxS